MGEGGKRGDRGGGGGGGEEGCQLSQGCARRRGGEGAPSLFALHTRPLINASLSGRNGGNFVMAPRGLTVSDRQAYEPHTVERGGSGKKERGWFHHGEEWWREEGGTHWHA